MFPVHGASITVPREIIDISAEIGTGLQDYGKKFTNSSVNTRFIDDPPPLAVQNHGASPTRNCPMRAV